MNNYTTPWREKQVKTIAKLTNYRKKNRHLATRLRELTDPQLLAIADYIEDCGSYITMTATADNAVKITAANFCRQRLCAVCAWRRQARFVATTYPALELLTNNGFTLLFVTLTVKNVCQDKIGEATNELSEAYTRLNRSAICSGVQGYVRSIEVTFNQDTETWHPHIHAIWIMPADYSPIHPEYISQPALIKAWRKALRAGYNPNVDIRMLRPTKLGTQPYIEAIKYALKPADLTAEQTAALYYALKGKRLISFGGLLAHLRQALSEHDPLLDHVQLRDEILAQTVYQINPHGGQYEIVSQIIRRNDHV